MTFLAVIQRGQIPVPPTPPPPPTVTPQIVGATSDLATMQTQLIDLNVQLAGARAEQTGLRRQLQLMLQTNPARPQVQARDAEVGLKIANLEGQAATLQAQIAAKQGTSIIGVPPRPPRFNPPVANESKMAFVLALVILLPLSLAIARRIMRGAGRPVAVHDPEIASRLGRLEQAVDTIAIEIERVSEGQRFMTKLMAERPSSQSAQSAAADPSSSAAQTPRALGAGPIEPIPVPSRQGVRQSVTPY